MTKSQLIKALQKIDGDPVIIVKDGFWWANIKNVTTEESAGVIVLDEDYSPFSDE